VKKGLKDLITFKQSKHLLRKDAKAFIQEAWNYFAIVEYISSRFD